MNASRRPVRRTLALCAALFLFSGCALPKIIVLHDPLSVEEHLNLGKIYQSQGKFDQAAQQYRVALEQDPRSLSALLLSGDLSYQTGRLSEAESAYKKALKLDPSNGDIYNNLCWVYLAQRASLHKAEVLIGKALELTPEHRPYYLDTRGVILLRLGRAGEAAAAFEEAVELLPKDKGGYLAETYGHLAEARRVLGDETGAWEAEQSAQAYRRSLTDSPGGNKGE